MSKPEQEYLVSDGTYTRHVWAASTWEAAANAAYSWSVSHLRLGVTLDVMPLAEASRIRVQYERPNAVEPPGANERLGGDYGRPMVVAEFQRLAK